MDMFGDREVASKESMVVRKMTVSRCHRDEVVRFIEENHYSGSINGVKTEHCFALRYEGETIGAMIYAEMAMHNQWKKFGESKSSVIELRRLCCIDETPKNTESYFIGKTLRWLKKHTNIAVVVSYADAEYGHTGVIYRASNFKYHGLSAGAKVIDWNGKKYHDKTIRTKYKGEIKPFAQKVKEALEGGEAKYCETAGKHTYTYSLDN